LGSYEQEEGMSVVTVGLMVC